MARDLDLSHSVISIIIKNTEKITEAIEQSMFVQATQKSKQRQQAVRRNGETYPHG